MLVSRFYFCLCFCNLFQLWFTFGLYFSAPGHNHVPSWVWIVAGLLNFTAYTLGESLVILTLCASISTLCYILAINTIPLFDQMAIPQNKSYLLLITQNGWLSPLSFLLKINGPGKKPSQIQPNVFTLLCWVILIEQEITGYRTI